MKKYTQSDFDNFEVDENGYKICPSGDYTQISDFGEGCRFGAWCIFGERCSFGAWCIFGEVCIFGEGCRFGAKCCFGVWCSFGEVCIFGEGCRFGAWCSFGACCRFGAWCSFGARCSFGEGCSFDEKCSFENGAVKNGRYVAVDRIGSVNRKAYFFMDEDGEMFVRAGCWFSDMATFRERVKEVHAGTIHEKTYLAACDFAELMLEGGQVRSD